MSSNKKDYAFMSKKRLRAAKYRQKELAKGHKYLSNCDTTPDKNPDYSWQDRAIRKWVQSGKRGIIEAVTGSGKSHVGIEALARLYEKDKTLSTLIIVPTIPLMDQWYEKLISKFPLERIGRIGGGYNEKYNIPPLAYIATIHSALRHTKSLFNHCWDEALKKRYKCFLIADECHHYIDAPVWSKIVKPPFHWDYTMGLSATIEPFEAFGLGQIIFKYSFKDAYRDGLVPQFDLINTGVPLTQRETEKYFELSEKISDLFVKVFREYADELKYCPDYWIFKRLQQLVGKIGSGKEPLIEKLFLALFKRAEIYYMAQHKMELAETTACKLIEQDKKIFVFFERIAAADYVNDNIALRAGKELIKRIKANGNVWCKAYHSQINKTDRKQILEEFQDQRSGALIVCRSLDEGLDVPDADGAILAASTKSARQRIQRIGRVLRRGDGNKRPVIVILFAKGTNDEGVTAEDHKEFEGIATIYEPIGTAEFLSILKRVQFIRHQDEEPSQLSDKWLQFGEVGPDETEFLVNLMSRHIRQGDLIKLEYANGKAVEGKYRFHTSHTINFYGHSISTDNLIRVYRENDRV